MRTGEKLGYLSAFYFVQGLPFGFQAVALPVLLREEGVSRTAIALAGAVAMPWMLKALWAPAVDRFGSVRFGRRRSWIVPMQAGLALSCAAAAVVPAESGLATLLGLILLMNLFAATMDIAVDGLAVDLLRPEELGYGNIAQVVGYKVGMLTGGGVLLWLSESWGYGGLFLSMSGLVAGVFVLTLVFREPRASHAPERTTVGEVLAALWKAAKVPGALWVLLFIATYKCGESMADAMFKPFLTDAGYSRGEIGFMLGIWGRSFSIAGSVAGGILASRMKLLPAVAITAALRAVAVGGEWWISITAPTPDAVMTVAAFESFLGGALTTAMFAYMMSRVDKRIGATHYTVLATVEVLGKTPPSLLSGAVADATGYSTVFGLATMLSLGFLALLWPLRERRAS